MKIKDCVVVGWKEYYVFGYVLFMFVLWDWICSNRF